MGNHTNSIEINGRLYDAATGKPIAQKSSSTHQTAPKHNGTVMDGFFRKNSALKQSNTKPAAPKQAVTAPKSSATKSHTRAKAAEAGRHKPQKSHTLMRKVVKKPQLRSADTTPAVRKKAPSVDVSRLHRAKQTPKSAFVKRFPSFSAHSAFIKKVTTLDVQPVPGHITAHTSAHPSSPRHTAAAAPAQSKAEKLFSQAIEEAPTSANTAKHPKIRKRYSKYHRVVGLGTGIMAVLLLVGFIAYQNMPNMYLRLASAQAGFSANMPGYTPAGFSNRSSIESKPGQVSISFHSNSDQRNFTITQKVSNWNSQALLENFVVANGKTYQTMQDKGKVIYMYDGSNATWVNGGVWYQIDGNSSLNNDQLLRIIDSI